MWCLSRGLLRFGISFLEGDKALPNVFLLSLYLPEATLTAPSLLSTRHLRSVCYRSPQREQVEWDLGLCFLQAPGMQWGLLSVTRCRTCQVTGPLLLYKGTVCL